MNIRITGVNSYYLHRPQANPVSASNRATESQARFGVSAHQVRSAITLALAGVGALTNALPGGSAQAAGNQPPVAGAVGAAPVQQQEIAIRQDLMTEFKSRLSRKDSHFFQHQSQNGYITKNPRIRGQYSLNWGQNPAYRATFRMATDGTGYLKEIAIGGSLQNPPDIVEFESIFRSAIFYAEAAGTTPTSVPATRPTPAVPAATPVAVGPYGIPADLIKNANDIALQLKGNPGFPRAVALRQGVQNNTANAGNASKINAFLVPLETNPQQDGDFAVYSTSQLGSNRKGTVVIVEFDNGQLRQAYEQQSENGALVGTARAIPQGNTPNSLVLWALLDLQKAAVVVSSSTPTMPLPLMSGHRARGF